LWFSTELTFTVQFNIFLHPDQAENTQSGMQGQETTAVAVIKSMPHNKLKILIFWYVFAKRNNSIRFML